jgi:hypothetical protein
MNRNPTKEEEAGMRDLRTEMIDTIYHMFGPRMEEISPEAYLNIKRDDHGWGPFFAVSIMFEKVSV